jgi:hypothetical protein
LEGLDYKALGAKTILLKTASQARWPITRSSQIIKDKPFRAFVLEPMIIDPIDQ